VLIGRRAALHLAFDRMIEDFDGALRRVHARRAAVQRPDAATGDSGKSSGP